MSNAFLFIVAIFIFNVWLTEASCERDHSLPKTLPHNEMTMPFFLQTLTQSFSQLDHDRDGVITIAYEQFLHLVFSLRV